VQHGFQKIRPQGVLASGLLPMTRDIARRTAPICAAPLWGSVLFQKPVRTEAAAGSDRHNCINLRLPTHGGWCLQTGVLHIQAIIAIIPSLRPSSAAFTLFVALRYRL
jgi:hypothetical protein